MLGWEFPPFKAGGLGVHCYELTKEMSLQGVDVDFYMPDVNMDIPSTGERVTIHQVKGSLDLGVYKRLHEDFFGAVDAYNRAVALEAIKQPFDVIHCHDWLTYLGGLELKRLSGKPLVVTVHSSEWDRSGGKPSDWLFNLEKNGMLGADAVITVSRRMKANLSRIYGIDPNRIHAVYNGVNPPSKPARKDRGLWGKKVILYLGRLTIQKNPEAYLKAAKRVIDERKDVHFFVAGTGEMSDELVKRSMELGISEYITFTGFISDEEANWLYSIADIYVLPAISEPFGITVLEAMVSGAAVIISKDVGVGEALDHCLKVDFWNADDIAQNMLALLEYAPLREMVAREGGREALLFTWERCAQDTANVYRWAMTPEDDRGKCVGDVPRLPGPDLDTQLETEDLEEIPSFILDLANRQHELEEKAEAKNGKGKGRAAGRGRAKASTSKGKAGTTTAKGKAKTTAGKGKNTTKGKGATKGKGGKRGKA